MSAGGLSEHLSQEFKDRAWQEESDGEERMSEDNVFSCAAMHPCFQGPRQRGVGGWLLIYSDTSTLFIFIPTARFGNLNATCPELYGQFKGPSGEPGLDTC